jgi:low temperature requirement protein LtrA
MTAPADDRPRTSSVVRPREVARAVTPLELFFDLVYVFTVSQLARHLLDHVDARGMAETLVLTLAVMYAWFMTVWTSNWLDGDR